MSQDRSKSLSERLKKVLHVALVGMYCCQIENFDLRNCNCLQLSSTLGSFDAKGRSFFEPQGIATINVQWYLVLTQLCPERVRDLYQHSPKQSSHTCTCTK